MRPRKYKTVEEAKEANRVRTRELKRRLLHEPPRPQYIFLLENPTGKGLEPIPSPAKGWQAVHISHTQAQCIRDSPPIIHTPRDHVQVT
jgi:hypothetical protein